MTTALPPTQDKLVEIKGKRELLVAYYDFADKATDAEDDVDWLIQEVKRLRGLGNEVAERATPKEQP